MRTVRLYLYCVASVLVLLAACARPTHNLALPSPSPTAAGRASEPTSVVAATQVTATWAAAVAPTPAATTVPASPSLTPLPTATVPPSPTVPSPTPLPAPTWTSKPTQPARTPSVGVELDGLAPGAVAAAADACIAVLENLDVEALASLVHPDDGVRFSPYSYVNLESDLAFAAGAVKGLLDDPTVYLWGSYDGSGLPIRLTFQAYYARFIYDVDFAHPQVVAYNEVIGQGNTINNISSVYPDGVFVELHFRGFDPQLGGMDWRSLRLVFREKDGIWYLIGIIHDEWTI